MDTYATADECREAKRAKAPTGWVVPITTTDGSERWIACRVPGGRLAEAIQTKPMPPIAKVLGDGERMMPPAPIAPITPAMEARREVNALFRRAEARRDYPGDYFPLLGKAEAALKQWQADYPAEARSERVQALRDKADGLRSKATYARIYDADGMLDADAREKRAAEYEADATRIDTQADKLERGE